jgi:predicted small secreted protein
MMKRVLFVLIALFLAGCATMMGDRTVNVTGEQIAQKLNEKFALPISLLRVFDVSLSNSIVTFDQASGRMITTMDSQLTSQLFQESLAGKLSISGKLRFDAVKNSVVLDEPMVESFDVGGANGQHKNLLNALAKTVGGDMLNGLTLYQVKPDDLYIAGIQYNPKDMQVTEHGLQITLSPLR